MDDKIEIGVYPLAAYDAVPVVVSLDLGAERAASTPPIGLKNSVTDLSITELPAGMVRLEWTEVNCGDYNIDGAVTIQDLSPLGMFFGLNSSSPNWNVAKNADGNGDGIIGITDLVPIGANYRSEVAGYNVKHAAAGSPPPFPVVAELNRADFVVPLSKPHYSIDFPGAYNDEWVVSPFDRDKVEGTGSNGIVIDRIDVRNSIFYSGSDLWWLDGSGSGALSADSYIMRIVAPGDWPGRSPIVPGVSGQLGVMLFDGLPRQLWLMADFVFAPTVDPVTGSSPTLYTDQWIVSVPFELPLSNQQLQIDNAITLTPRATAGYYIDFNVTQTLLDTSQSLSSRLDPLNYIIACDTTGDTSFGDEAWLWDSDRDGVSDALLDRQKGYNDYDVHGVGLSQPVLIKATIGADLSIKYGFIELVDKFEDRSTTGEPDWRPILDPVTLRFTERTRFALVHNYGDPDSQYESNFDPSTLTSGDELLIYGHRLIGPSGLGYTHQYWADRILKKVTP